MSAARLEESWNKCEANFTRKLGSRNGAFLAPRHVPACMSRAPRLASLLRCGKTNARDRKFGQNTGRRERVLGAAPSRFPAVFGYEWNTKRRWSPGEFCGEIYEGFPERTFQVVFLREYGNDVMRWRAGISMLMA